MNRHSLTVALRNREEKHVYQKVKTKTAGFAVFQPQTRPSVPTRAFPLQRPPVGGSRWRAPPPCADWDGAGLLRLQANLHAGYTAAY